jgi:hypothetical protein
MLTHWPRHGCPCDEETLLGELLRDGAPDTPAHADRLGAIVQRLAVRQQVLRPFACHFEVAPTTTATCLPFELCRLMANLFLFCF